MSIGDKISNKGEELRARPKKASARRPTTRT